MKKFFLFRKEEVNAGSVDSSDTGQGLSVIGLPADSLAFVTAGVGNVIMYLNGASKYEESNLTDGESFEKTSVTISCEEGKETELIESILSFISRDGGKGVMKFDAVESESTFSNVSFDLGFNAKVRINPVKRVTGEISTQTFIGTSGTAGVDVASTSIGGIDFGIEANKPALDFNHEGISGVSNNTEISSWANAGTGGSSYNIAANVGAPKKFTGGGAPKVAMSKDYAQFTEADHFVVPTYTAEGTYTAYVVFSFHNTANTTPIYGSADTGTFGPFIGKYNTNANGDVVSHGSAISSTVAFRHKDRKGLPAIAKTGSSSDGTRAWDFPTFGSGPAYPEHLQVFVIRRDVKNGLFVYNRNGDLIAFAPAVTGSVTDATNHRTDGDLVIERLGTVGNLTTGSFNGNVARFGVIEKDIGSAACSTLATDLFNLYKI